MPAEGDDEAELVPQSVQVGVGALSRQDEGDLVAVVAVVGGTIFIAVADPFMNATLKFGSNFIKPSRKCQLLSIQYFSILSSCPS